MLRIQNQEFLLMTNEELKKKSAAKKIKKHISEFTARRQKERKERMASLSIQKFFRGRFVRNTSFINALKLHKYPRIFFLKEQKPTFVRLIKKILPLLESRGLSFESLTKSITEETRFDTVRVAEPDLFDFKKLPLTQLLAPSNMSRLRFNQAIPKERWSSVKLVSFYFTEDKAYTDHFLERIKKRNCYVKP